VTVLEWVLLVLLAIIFAVWVWRALAVYFIEGAGPILNRDSFPGLGDAGLVSVIVPARDEEQNIGAALETLLAQDYRNLEVIVVNDRSRDRTAEIVREFSARDGRVRLLEVESLPEGWFGKPHALDVGARAARGEWLLFVDADCRQAPHSVRVGLGLLVDRKADMLSLWPILEMRGFWENAIQPAAAAIMATWFRPSRVNNPKWPLAFANGQYILVRRAAYEAIGGYKAVRTEIAEDMALARAVKRAGHRLLNAVGSDLFSTRMYAGFGPMWQGWTRIYLGSFRTAPFLAAVILMILVFSLGPVAAAVGAAVAMLAGAGGAYAAIVLGMGLCGAVTMGITLRYAYILGRVNPWYVWIYPFVMALVLGFLVSALARALGIGGIRWRGTTYKRGKVVDGGT
jgi:glycosyltransferase involved in cell wall biosynthesis